jgi:hypothetical protein
LGATACDGTTASSDAGAADSGPAVCDPAPAAFETGDPDGHADPLGAGTGEVRAGRLEESELPDDRTGLGTYAAGDFVLASDRFALIVEDVGDSDLYDPYGGRPVGIARVEDGALVEAGDFNEILFGFGSHLIRTEQVTVMSDGSEGPAIVRATGPLHVIEFAGPIIPSLVPGDFAGVPAAIDYEMAPGADEVDVYMSVAATTPRRLRVPFMLTGLFQRYRMPSWTQSGGFSVPGTSEPMVAFVDDAATSYAWVAPPDGSLERLVDIAGVLVFSSGEAVTVPGCETTRVHLGTLVLGGPGLGGLQRSLAERAGESTRTITGTVTEADGTAATDVRVHVLREDGGHFARVSPAADGTFSVDAPAGPASVAVFRAGESLLGPVTVDATQSSIGLEMPTHGTVVVRVADRADPTRALPARVQVLPTVGAPEIPSSLGELTHAGGRAHVAFSTGGSVSLRVDPGEHRVIVSRGYEYELHTETITVAAGESVTVEALLDHAVDTTNVMCADYHIHTHRSPDSTDSPGLKLMGLIADGLEIPVRSDHEWVNDFQPFIEAMGLGDWAFGISGEELTTFAWGHFNAFPMVEDPSRPNGGAVPWVGRLPPEVFAEVRSRPEAPAFTVNHPRSAGGFGYFLAAGYDPATGAVDHPELWDEEFDLVEVFNDANFERAAEIVADWFSLLNSGRRVFAVGSSDSHLIWGSPVGYPRTCLSIGTDDPRALDANRVRDVTRAGHSFVSGGMYLSVSGPDGSAPGDEVSGVGPTASFDVTVQAASWVQGDARLEVYVDGSLVETLPITEADRGEGAIRLQTSGIEVPVAASGSWVVFHAAIDGDLSPVHPGRAPFAVTNPIFLRR